MSNDIGINTLDVERAKERERQQREILEWANSQPVPKFMWTDFTIPTSYLVDKYGLDVPQGIILGDADPLFGILARFGIGMTYGPPAHSPKVISISIASEWTEVSVEWSLT